MSWFRKFMQGRYGTDQLSIGLLILMLLISILGRFLKLGRIIDYIYIGIAFILFFRIFSKDISKRYQENMKFLGYWKPIKSKFANKAKHIKDSKHYRYYKCSNCGQKLRVPRGKGKISISCPKCKVSMIKKS